MQKTVEFISGTICKKPYAIQIAKDNKWDSCLVLNLQNDTELLIKSEHFLKAKDFQILSIEILFTDHDGLTTIFGATYNKNLLCGEEEKFLQAIIHETEGFRGFKSFITHLDKILCGGKKVLLGGKPDLVRVGVVNHWFSVGPCQIWEKLKDKIIDEQKISALLDSRQDVCLTKLNFQGISFIFNNNEFLLYHWIKPQCGTKNNGYYAINKERILSLCSHILN